MKKMMPPVENHPLYPVWSPAYDRFILAGQRRAAHNHLRKNDPARVAAEAEYREALMELNRISEQL